MLSRAISMGLSLSAVPQDAPSPAITGTVTVIHPCVLTTGRIEFFCASQNCFGEQGADAFGLVQKMDGCGFRDAKNRLAEYCGVPAPIAVRKSRSQAPVVHSGAGSGKSGSRSKKRPLASAEIVRQRLEGFGYRVAAEYPLW